jgi:formamidopyrimidine-DNA glycosylase
VPELPEVQAHAERLTEQFGGAELERFTPLSFSVLKTVVPSPADAVGAALTRVGRRGKLLMLEFGELTFVVHLMQGGRLVPDEAQSAKPRNGMARWRFADGRALLLTEAGKERKAGVWVVSGVRSPSRRWRTSASADVVSHDQLAVVLGAKNQRLHGFLRDQHGLAGLGRMLANEICHRAKLSPFAMTGKLSDDDIDRLRAAITACISDALGHERTLDKMSKSADRPGAVHRRKGATCPVCGDEVRAVEYNAYEVDYCPTCQTGGKVLADNTTSKFLK